jgi:cell wall-associated NlpC family hydrolase
MIKKQPSRRSVTGKKRAAASRPLKKRRRIVRRPVVRRAAAITTKHGPLIVRHAARHIGEIFSQRDCSHFIHLIFTECGLVYPHTSTRYFPPINYFTQVKTPLAGDIVLYAEHMGIYAPTNKIIIADPAAQQILVSTTASFLNFKGYYRWYQD